MKRRATAAASTSSIMLASESINKHPKHVSKFLLKSEPDLPIQSFIDQPDQIVKWDGIRNYQARNIQREMKCGDQCFFYHANIHKNNGIYGIVEVVKEAYDDIKAFDPNSPYYDPKAIPGLGKWLAVDIQLIEIWDKPILLSELKELLQLPQQDGSDSPLRDMMLFKMSRLSTQRVTQSEWEYIINMKSSKS